VRGLLAESECSNASVEWRAREAGFHTYEGKLVYPPQRLTFLGIVLDSNADGNGQRGMRFPRCGGRVSYACAVRGDRHALACYFQRNYTYICQGGPGIYG
jgi:hypothetical protein